MKVSELGFTLAVKTRYLPTVLTANEVKMILNQLSGRNKLIIQLLFGSGLRVGECLRLGVQELFGHNNVKTTQIYTQVLGQHYAGSVSPLDNIT